MVYGEYDPVTDETTIYEDRIERDGIDYEMVAVHESLHRQQFQRIPYFLEFLALLVLLPHVFTVVGVLTLEHRWFTYSAAAWFTYYAVLELPVYAATYLMTGGYTSGFLEAILKPSAIYVAGLAMQTLGAKMLYNPEFVPKRARPFLHDNWREEYRGAPEPFLLQGGTSG